MHINSFSLLQDGKKIVSPDWVHMCQDESRKVEEEIFPHNYNPKMTLNITSTFGSPPKRQRRGGDAGEQAKKKQKGRRRQTGKTYHAIISFVVY